MEVFMEVQDLPVAGWLILGGLLLATFLLGFAYRRSRERSTRPAAERRPAETTKAA